MTSPPIISDCLAQLAAVSAAVHRPLRFMEVCGTHTMSAFRSGLHSLLPDNVTLLSGPGCPVCVTAQEDIDTLVYLAQHDDLILCTYGDMLRVPGRSGTLEQARSRGADIRVVYSAIDALTLARQHPARQVVFAAVGFETTAPATAAVVRLAKQQSFPNFSVLASHKRVVPAMLALLAAGAVQIDGFLCPGHVSAVIGSAVYRPIVDLYKFPCVIAGFEEIHMARALLHLAQMARDNRPELINDYTEVVNPAGNLVAQQLLNEVFTIIDVRWRGLGVIPSSGLALRPEFHSFDAQQKFSLPLPVPRELPGCICGQVITGIATPHDCKSFGRSCTPVHPLGPCMVSSEGTCQAYFKYARLGGRWSGSFQQPTPATASMQQVTP